MKRLSMFCLSALLVLALSCKKEQKPANDFRGEGFYATLESPVGEGKTHLDGLAVNWNNLDEIKVFSQTDTDGKCFVTNAVGSPAKFEAVGSLGEDFYEPNYTAFFPAGAVTKNGSSYELTLPAAQDYVENSFAVNANPMAVISENNVLDFQNLCGVIRFDLHSETSCTVKEITLASNNDSENLWGTGTVTFSGGTPSLGTLADGGNSITLNCGTGVTIGTTAASATSFHFVVPAGVFSTGFTIKVTDVENKIWKRTANADNTMNQNRVRLMPETGIVTHVPVVPETVTTTIDCPSCTHVVSGDVAVSGSHSFEYGFVYAKTSENNDPVIGGTGCSKVVLGTENAKKGTASNKHFTADFGSMGLEEDVDYTFKAYGICEDVKYGEKVSFSYSVLRPWPTEWTAAGHSSFTYSVSATKKVYFSRGNLQYIGSAATPYWKFADYQMDFFGSKTAQQGSSASNIDRDMFGWGTSGWNYKGAHAVCTQPWSTSTTDTDYQPYGSNSKNLYDGNDKNDDKGKADWGAANTISNGGTGWRTLTGKTGGEWDYLIYGRTNNAALWGLGTIGNGQCAKKGLIILPDYDQWHQPSGVNFTAGCGSGYNTNMYSYSQWAVMETAGAVFLPVMGYRDGTEVKSYSSSGYYWASTISHNNTGSNTNYAGDILFTSSSVSTKSTDSSGNPGGGQQNKRHYGLSVRLVKDAN